MNDILNKSTVLVLGALPQLSAHAASSREFYSEENSDREKRSIEKKISLDAASFLIFLY